MVPSTSGKDVLALPRRRETTGARQDDRGAYVSPLGLAAGDQNTNRCGDR